MESQLEMERGTSHPGTGDEKGCVRAPTAKRRMRGAGVSSHGASLGFQSCGRIPRGSTAAEYAGGVGQ